MLSQISRRRMLSRPGEDHRPCVTSSEVTGRANWLKPSKRGNYPSGDLIHRAGGGLSSPSSDQPIAVSEVAVLDVIRADLGDEAAKRDHCRRGRPLEEGVPVDASGCRTAALSRKHSDSSQNREPQHFPDGATGQ
jgi:hypothetical protein